MRKTKLLKTVDSGFTAPTDKMIEKQNHNIGWLKWRWLYTAAYRGTKLEIGRIRK